MTVKKLQELLGKLPQNLEVLVASDDEGNSFRTIPDNWVSVEKFDENLDIIHEDDYSEYSLDELSDFVVVG